MRSGTATSPSAERPCQQDSSSATAIDRKSEPPWRSQARRSRSPSHTSAVAFHAERDAQPRSAEAHRARRGRDHRIASAARVQRRLAMPAPRRKRQTAHRRSARANATGASRSSVAAPAAATSPSTPTARWRAATAPRAPAAWSRSSSSAWICAMRCSAVDRAERHPRGHEPAATAAACWRSRGTGSRRRSTPPAAATRSQLLRDDHAGDAERNEVDQQRAAVRAEHRAATRSDRAAATMPSSSVPSGAIGALRLAVLAQDEQEQHQKRGQEQLRGR